MNHPRLLTKKEKTIALKKHIGYELQMLLTAREIVKKFDSAGMGAACSIARDSIYVHARLLGEFFEKEGGNYINVGMYDGESFEIFSKKEKQALIEKVFKNMSKST